MLQRRVTEKYTFNVHVVNQSSLIGWLEEATQHKSGSTNMNVFYFADYWPRRHLLWLADFSYLRKVVDSLGCVSWVHNILITVMTNIVACKSNHHGVRVYGPHCLRQWPFHYWLYFPYLFLCLFFPEFQWNSLIVVRPFLHKTGLFKIALTSWLKWISPDFIVDF